MTDSEDDAEVPTSGCHPSFDNDPYIGITTSVCKRLLRVKAFVCERDVIHMM